MIHGGAIICGLCGSTGRRTIHHPPSGQAWQLGPDAIMVDGGGSSVVACECRHGLARRYAPGEAALWETETVYTAAVDEVFGDRTEIRVDTDLPRDSRWFPLQRHGNRYMASFVDVEIHGQTAVFDAEGARALGHALLEAARVADAIDLADLDPCGHFAPCTCWREKHDWLDFNRRVDGLPVRTFLLTEILPWSMGLAMFVDPWDDRLDEPLLTDDPTPRPTHDWLGR